MKITYTDIWKLSIPMHPFTIATGTMNYAQNIFIRVHTDTSIVGVGECSAFPMIVGETQNTCFEMAKEFAALWKGKDILAIEERLGELHAFTAFNSTIKSAFDMALYDVAAKHQQQPLYAFLGGQSKPMETDLTIGIDTPQKMAETAVDFVNRGVNIIKIKLGYSVEEDVLRVKKISEAVGSAIKLRIDANQGWSFDEAVLALTSMADYNIQFCEQPMHYRHDEHLPSLRKISPIPIMADESVYDHHDAERLIKKNACDYVNIKLSKSGGIHEAIKINNSCARHQIPCMMGGMLESRLALTAFAHFAAARENIIFYDMDTCMLGHKTDPVKDGLRFNGFNIELPELPGIGADISEDFLGACDHIRI